MARLVGRKHRVLSRAVAYESLERRTLLSVSPAGPEFLVNLWTTNLQDIPSIAMDGDGDFVIAWRSVGQDGSFDGVYARRYNALGQSQGNEFRVNSYTTGNQGFPSAAMDADGDFVIAWQSDGQDGAVEGVYAQRYNAAGTPQGAEFRVNTHTPSRQQNPAVGINAHGDFVIAWESSLQDGSDFGVYAQRYDAAGARQGGEFRVNTYTTGNQWIPSVGMDADGAFVVTWQSAGQDGSGNGVYAQRYNAAGTPQGAEFRVNTTTTNSQNSPSVAMDASGDFVISWQSAVSLFDTDVFAQRYNAAGVPQGAEFRVNTYTPSFQAAPSVAMDVDGDFIIAWQSQTQDGSNNGVYAQSFNAAGVPIGNEFRVNTFTTGSQHTPAIAMSHAGDFAVAWQSDGQDGSDSGVYAQRYTESTDTAGPMVAGVFIAGSRVQPYSVQQPPTQQIVVSFSEVVVGADSVGNWRLTRDGGDVTSDISSITFGFNTTLHRYEAVVNLSTSYAGGNFDLIARDGLQDPAGNALDGNFNGTPGGHFSLPFSMAALASGDEFQVNTYTTGDQIVPSVASNPAGDFVVVWRSWAQDGSEFGVYAQRYSAAGTPQGGEFQVNTTTLADQTFPSVAMDGTGNFVVTWTNIDLVLGRGNIYARRYSATGVPLSGELQVTAATTFHQAASRVALAANGDFVITWSSQFQDGFAPSVFARRYNAAGLPQGAEFRVNTYTTDHQLSPNIALDAAGNFVVTWTSGGQDGHGNGIYARQFNAAGAAQGGEFRVNTFTTGDQELSSVAMDADGNFVITWRSLGQISDDWSMHAQRFSPAGLPQGAEFQVNSFTTIVTSQAPKVAMDAVGNFVIAWTSIGQDGDSYGVYARRYKPSGLPQGDEFRVNTYTTSAQRRPWVAMNAGGNFVIAWDSFQQDGSSLGVFAQRYTVQHTPTVGSLTDSPDPVAAGATVTLSAGGVVDDGTVTSVSFYRESNGVAGLQVGAFGDTFVGTANAPAGGVWSVNISTAGLATGTYTYWAQATDDIGLTGKPASTANTVLPSTIPSVTMSSFHYATLPHALRFTFDLNVSASLGLDDIIVAPMGGGPQIPVQSISYNFATNTATFDFDNHFDDGRYRATLIASGITGPSGMPMAADHVFDFQFLLGDANNDGVVNLADFNILASNFGQSPRNFTQGDFNYDGVVNLQDFNILASRFGQVLGAGRQLAGGSAPLPGVFAQKRIGSWVDCSAEEDRQEKSHCQVSAEPLAVY